MKQYRVEEGFGLAASGSSGNDYIVAFVNRLYGLFLVLVQRPVALHRAQESFISLGPEETAEQGAWCLTPLEDRRGF
jgi:hypothetical protein